MLNTYPLYVARNLTFTAKQASLQGQVSVISSSVSVLGSITEDSVTQVMRLLELDGMNRVLITDAEGVSLYDERDSSAARDEHAQWGVGEALTGNDTFRSSFAEGEYRSCASGPIIVEDRVAGAVYVYESDETQGTILLELQRNIRFVTLAVFFAALVLSMVFATTLTRRIRLVLDAIKNVREGDYSMRVEVGGNDELSKLGEEFDSLTTRLQTTEEMRRRFVSDASHELKTPLASIRLLSDSILQNPEVDMATVMEFVRDIGGESERLARTTEKLLNLTRHDNRILASRIRVNISVAADGAISILKPIASTTSVTLLCDLGADCYVLATEDDVYQIVINLVENAIKYNVRGGKVFIKTVRRGDIVLLTVADTGIGIPEANLPNIFDRFYRVDKARSRETGGSGLGLSIVQATVQEHGGTVKAERREAGGMRFLVTFPYCPEESEPDAE